MVGTHLEEMKKELQKAQQEVRMMKAQTGSIHIKMHREEKKQAVGERKADHADLVKWRRQFESGLREQRAKVAQESLKQELGENKDYQEFKRKTKQDAREKGIELTGDAYLEHKEHSEWHAERRRAEQAERIRHGIEESLGQLQHMGECQLEEQRRQDLEERQDRLERYHEEATLMLLKAQQEREQHLHDLTHAQAHQEKPVKHVHDVMGRIVV